MTVVETTHTPALGPCSPVNGPRIRLWRLSWKWKRWEIVHTN